MHRVIARVSYSNLEIDIKIWEKKKKEDASEGYA